MAWDVTCPDTFAPSHLQASSEAAGSAATEAEVAKRAKYIGLGAGVTFVPIAVETAGAWGPEGWRLISEVGKRLEEASGDRRSTEFLRQRISIAVQRGNAASVLGTFGTAEGADTTSDPFQEMCTG